MKIVSNSFPKPIQLSPVSINDNKINNYPTGNDPMKYNLSISPQNDWYEDETFARELPDLRCKNVYNKEQNVSSKVCYSVNNANYKL